MRVLVFSPDDLRNHMGGLGVHVENTLREIVAINPDVIVDVLVISQGVTWDLVPGRVTVHYLNYPGSIVHNAETTYEFLFRLQVTALADAMRLPVPDLVHAHDWTVFDAARTYCELMNVPLASTVHLAIDDLIKFDETNTHRYYPKAVRAMRDIQALGIYSSHALMSVSNHYLKKFSSSITNCKTVLVGNGVDMRYWNDPIEPFKFPGNKPKKLVYVGRLAYMKNVHGLINTPLPDDVDLIIVAGPQGADSNIPKLLESACNLRDNIHHIGPLYGKDKVMCMRSAWSGIFPSINEPFGIVGLEWMMSNVPFICSYVDGMVDYLEDGMAVRCDLPPNDLRKAIDTMSNLDKDTKIRMTRSAKQKASLYSWGQVARRTMTGWSMAMENAKQVRSSLASHQRSLQLS